jgi:hypothetical protein
MSFLAVTKSRKFYPENGNPENGNFDHLKPGKFDGNSILKTGNFYMEIFTKTRKIFPEKYLIKS